MNRVEQSNNMPTTVPFGKYKGKPIEVLANDPEYVKWILSQQNIKSRYPEIISIVINNFQTPSETPEHNAIQVKFIDPVYRLKFANFVSKFPKKDFEETLLSIKEAVNKYLEKTYSISINLSYVVFEQSQDDGELEVLEKRNELAKQLLENAGGVKLKTTEVIFESNGLDVLFSVSIDVINENSRVVKLYQECEIDYKTYQRRYLIEIKPVVSDDFPAVLRQMKLSGAKILFLSKYTGIGAKQEEFVKYFETQGINVVFESDIENYVFENIEMTMLF